MIKMECITNLTDLLPVLCRDHKKWGMYFSTSENDELEIVKAAPWFNDLDRVHQINFCIKGGFGFLLFDSEEEMNKIYWQTVGDDGPTKTNTYDGPCRIYALTCDPTGQTLNENT